MGFLSCCSAAPITKEDNVLASSVHKSNENGQIASHKVRGFLHFADNSESGC